VFETLHPTQKPLELIKKLIQISSDPHMLIVDCFCGTGTTNIAALLTSRSCIGFEKDDLYFTHAKKRLIDLVSRYGEYQLQPTIERYIVNDRTKSKHK
jgi:DNA modification methylase